MARIQIEGCECDRCGEGIQLEKNDKQLEVWGAVYAATRKGVDIVGEKTVPADLCGDCLRELSQWFLGRKLRDDEQAKHEVEP